MKDFIKRHLHPLGGRIIFWNLLLLLIVKLILPQSTFQLASFINSIPVFDSREIIKFTNESRIANNLPPLKANLKLDLAASEKLNDMATQEYFAHVSPTGVNPWFWIKKSQYQYSVAGENLAMGFFTAKDTVQAWLNSPSHRANILNGKYQEIGVAAKAVEINGQNGILVVQMFGLQPQAALPGGVTGLSAPQAQSIPTRSPQVALISPSPTLNQSQQTQGESVVVQYTSTDEKSEPITEPVQVRFTDAESVRKFSNVLNNAFSVYISIIAVISAAAFLIFERNRNMALKMSFNAALFVLSILIPTAQLSFRGLIF